MTFKKKDPDQVMVFVVGTSLSGYTVYLSSRLALAAVDRANNRYKVPEEEALRQRDLVSSGRWMRADLAPEPHPDCCWWTSGALKIRKKLLA